MRIESYLDLGAFRDDVMELLAHSEVENNLPIGILNRGGGVQASGDAQPVDPGFGQRILRAVHGPI